MHKPEEQESPKTKCYILRSQTDTGVCLIIEASSAQEAQAKVRKLVADGTPYRAA